jgi:hypothetical protein
MSLTASSTLVAVKRRVVDPVYTVKILPVRTTPQPLRFKEWSNNKPRRLFGKLYSYCFLLMISGVYTDVISPEDVIHYRMRWTGGNGLRSSKRAGRKWWWRISRY